MCSVSGIVELLYFGVYYCYCQIFYFKNTFLLRSLSKQPVASGLPDFAPTTSVDDCSDSPLEANISVSQSPDMDYSEQSSDARKDTKRGVKWVKKKSSHRKKKQSKYITQLNTRTKGIVNSVVCVAFTCNKKRLADINSGGYTKFFFLGGGLLGSRAGNQALQRQASTVNGVS